MAKESCREEIRQNPETEQETPADTGGSRRQSLRESFANAWNGVVICFVEERNIKIHCFAAVMVLIFGNILKISVTEWCLCFICSA